MAVHYIGVFGSEVECAVIKDFWVIYNFYFSIFILKQNL